MCELSVAGECILAAVPFLMSFVIIFGLRDIQCYEEEAKKRIDEPDNLIKRKREAKKLKRKGDLKRLSLFIPLWATGLCLWTIF